MAGHGGGAWKVAYADFVTAMMAFFMVMWITGQSKQVRQAIAHYFNAPFKSAMKTGNSFTGEPTLYPPEQAITLVPPSPGVTAGGKAIVDRGPGVPIGDGLTRGRPSGTGHVTLHDANRQVTGAVIQFAEQSAELTEAAKATIRLLIPEILGKRNKIEVRGHTTRRPLAPGSPYQDAWQLAYARCVATKRAARRRGDRARADSHVAGRAIRAADDPRGAGPPGDQLPRRDLRPARGGRGPRRHPRRTRKAGVEAVRER